MKSLHKQDLLGLVAIAIGAAVIGYVTTAQRGFMVWAGASASVTVMEWLSRRRQRKLLPRMEAVTAEVLDHQRRLQDRIQAQLQDPALAATIAANVAAAERLQESLGEARKRLG